MKRLMTQCCRLPRLRNPDANDSTAVSITVATRNAPIATAMVPKPAAFRIDHHTAGNTEVAACCQYHEFATECDADSLSSEYSSERSPRTASRSDAGKSWPISQAA